MEEGIISVNESEKGVSKRKLVPIKAKFDFGDDNEPYTYQDFRLQMNIICSIGYKIVYFCWSIMQFYAICSGIEKLFPHGNTIILLISLILGFIPILGPTLAVGSVCLFWGWSFSYAVRFFIFPYFIVGIPLFMIGLFEIYKDWRRWQEEEQSKI